MNSPMMVSSQFLPKGPYHPMSSLSVLRCGEEKQFERFNVH